MTLDTVFHTLSLILQVSLLDLILSGDNAVVIALSCRNLPPRQLRQAMLLGTGAAIGLRVLLTTMVSMLLQVAMLKLIGAAMLIAIAIRLLIAEERAAQAADDTAPSGLWGAVMTVLLADLVMSVDNVIALAAVTQGSVLYLILGLLLSVALLMVSSRLMINLLRRYPLLIPAAAALLGYVAGEIAVSDPAIATWVATQSPALSGLVPLLCAVFVVLQSKIIERRRREVPQPAVLARAPRAAPVESAAGARGAAIEAPVATVNSAADAAEAGGGAHAGSAADTGSAADATSGRSANYLGLGSLIGNPIIQVTVSVLLAIFCMVFLPKALDVAILIAIIALIAFKVF
jgi:YjbE family integral membrane protein